MHGNWFSSFGPAVRGACIGGMLAASLLPATAQSATATPYQAKARAACSASPNAECVVRFPVVPAASSLAVQFVACELQSFSLSTAGKFDRARVYLRTVQDGKVIILPVATAGSSTSYPSDAIYATLSVPVEFLVPDSQRLFIVVQTWVTEDPVNIDCTIVGEMLGV